MKFYICFVLIVDNGVDSTSVTSDCAALGTCISSLTDKVNGVMASRPTPAAAESSSNITASSLSGGSPMSFTINDCATLLSDRLVSFQDFDATSQKVWSDVTAAQETMVAVEGSAADVLTTEAGFATQLMQISELMLNATERSTALKEWVDGEKVIRNQLTDLYNVLDKRVINVSDDVVITTSAIRDALMNMQKVHDHATQILTAVGDSETEMYLWAYNVSQKVNSHTVSLVSVAQTLQYRTNQVNAVKDANIKLNWIMSQLEEKYGVEKLTELSLEYDAGTLSLPPGAAQGPNSTSVTTKSLKNQIR